ncbi:MAG TPA: signal peptidase I [Candidatus Omnitrophota bacterium]|nr:signal peptidase I [Candidatus Omnitrophota bacterium]
MRNQRIGNESRTTNHEPRTKRFKSVAWEWVESIVVALILALVIRHFVIQAFKIPTGSMRMTLIEGDRIMVNKFIYGAKIPFSDIRLPGLRQPKRGDVVVFVYPEDPKKDFIKRLIGLPGETVEIKKGNIYINGELCQDPVVYNRYYYNRPETNYGSEGEPVNVPQDSYYVLGDNSASSRDSRYWGFVPKKNMLGNAILIYWPPHRIRIIK